MRECLIHKNTITLQGQEKYTHDAQETIDNFLTAAYWEFKIGYPKFHKMDTISKLGILTSSVLLETQDETYEPLRTGIIISSNSGCNYTDAKYIEAIQQDPESSYPALFTYTLPSIVMGEICIKHKIQGENMYMITEQFEESSCYELAKNMFQNKPIDNCLIGWIEVSDAHTYKSHLRMIRKEDTL